MIVKKLFQVNSALKKGGNKRLANQISNLDLSLKVRNIDGLSKKRLNKLDAILKEIAKNLGG